MLRLMLLGFVGFVMGLAGGWGQPVTFVSRSHAAEERAAQASTLHTEPSPGPAITSNERADPPDSARSSHAARKRRQLNAKLGMTSAKPADRANGDGHTSSTNLRTTNKLDDDDDDGDDE